MYLGKAYGLLLNNALAGCGRWTQGGSVSTWTQGQLSLSVFIL